MTTLKEFVLKVGLEDALILFGEQVWDKAQLTFEEWYSQQVSLRHNQELSEKILEKMLQLASTRSQLVKLWKRSPEESPVRSLIIERFKGLLNKMTSFEEVLMSEENQIKVMRAPWLQKLAELATGFQNWLTVLYQSNSFGLEVSANLAAHAKTMMAQCAVTAEEWEKVFHNSARGTSTKKQAVSKLYELAKTYEDWSKVCHWASNEDEGLAKRARANALGVATTFNEWFSIFCDVKEDADLRQFCMNKLLKLAKNFDNWLTIYQVSEGQLKSYALEELLEKASTLEDWEKVWRWTPDGSREKGRAAFNICRFVKID